MNKRILTLPTDSAERKNYPLLSGCLKYFPAALAGIANISKLGNDKHNPGQPMHHARGKSADHGDCILRHLTDTEDLLAAVSRGEATAEQVLIEASQLAWRALAYSQELHERFGAPLAPGAKLSSVPEAELASGRYAKIHGCHDKWYKMVKWENGIVVVNEDGHETSFPDDQLLSVKDIR